MKRLFLMFLLSLTIPVLFAQQVISGAPGQMTLQIPQQTLAQALAAIVPITLDRPKDMSSGTITIDRINDLKINDNELKALVSVSGRDMQVNTAIAGQQLRLNIGSAAMDFALSATIRFDRATRTLFLTPRVADINSNGNANAGAAGSLFAGLFNGREVPVAIEQLKPIITEAGGRLISIAPDLTNITATTGTISLAIAPNVTASPAPKKKS